MFGNKLKKIFSKEENEEDSNDKKKIENLVFFVVLLIITIIIINTIWNGNKKKENQENIDPSKKLANIETTSNVQTTGETNNLEEKLEKILGKIQGVGEVNICINYSETSEVVAMYNQNTKTSSTEETDTSGGTRKIQENDTQKDIIYKEENGEKTPITQKIIQPKIEGAIVTAKGARKQ